ncbi:HAUS augmin-like complex subunit 6 isoform X1 [Hippoglossus hippoglossus]|uniref:HAUS augmin-like complex subunit 6 isoform X1 n=1 Tax=Hippoglossus hippoglossus TaxID=8267 RepID=UPI00148C7306|nr:HAUS augmin-like complex subunit 6 isoform X1 [Hippoglossus hippoglossus]
MANPASLQKKNGRHLWLSLLGLGFQADTATSSIAKPNINAKHINLGPSMFDKPNKDASYIVIHFLLVKLSPTRFHDAYRHCWPILNPKADAEFRKVTCAWLREIMDETANAGSKVVASLFLSPGGPKFIGLMLQLANYVMLQEMKTFTTEDSWVPEAAAMPTSSLHMAEKRLNLTSKRFLKTAVDQDNFLQEYQRRAQLLVKSMRDLREEGAKYGDLLKRYSSDSAQEGASLAEKTKKVRSLWSDIDQMLSTTKEEQNAVASVLKGDGDEYILDGMDRKLKIPRCLLERIERLPHQLSSGNVYEAGQLNLLCVLELMTHALQILKDERSQVSHVPKFQLSPQNLQEKCQQMARVLQDLHLIRQKISKEEIPEVSGTIRDLEAEWDRKWMDTLNETPLVSFLNEDPALGFLSPMAPLSFKPMTEASYRRSVFSQYPAKLLEEKPAESKSHEAATPSYSNLKSSCFALAEGTDSPVGTTEASSPANTSLDWLFDTPPSPPHSAPAAPPPQTSVRKTTTVHEKVAPMRTKTQILDMECDNLADQFAEAVTTTSPSEVRVKGLDLEGLLTTLQGDPFSTKKQLTRTPESLIMDVKTSWRKAVEEDRAEKLRRSAKFNDSVTQLLASSQEPHDVSTSSDTQSLSRSTDPPVVSHSSPPVCQQGASFKTTLLWDTFDTLDSPSGTGSSAVQFTLDQETLPEMSSCDSLLSLDDDDNFLIPSLKTEATLSPQTTPHRAHIQQVCDGGSFIQRRTKTPECLLSGDTVSGVDRGWLMEPVQSVEASDKVFSLDLDRLETPSPPKKQEFSLPQLITFSPIDDMKC